MKRHLLLAAALVLTKCPALGRDIPLDENWRFLRGDVPGAENPAFDDASWRSLDLPHDWSIEDLPPKTDAVPELPVVEGEWRFHEGDQADWKRRDLDDRSWKTVKLPDIWEHHGQSTKDNVYGWFRRRLVIPAECKGKDLDLLLGKIDDVDEAWLNGERIGGTGSFPPDYHWADTVERRYRVPSVLVRGDGTDVLAVRVFDGANNGGIYQAGTRSARVGPFDPVASENADRTGYTVGGIGWYRRRFTLDEAGKHVVVHFEGVYMNSELWINGKRLGEHPHGYTGFEFDLTPYLNPPGKENVLAVRVRNEGRNSRWYSGSGIYRHVRLGVTDPLHVSSVFVTTPEVSRDKARVNIASELRNDGPAETEALIHVDVKDADGKMLQSAEGKLRVLPNETRSLDQFIELSPPKPWSLESPNLHHAEVRIIVAGNTVDSVSTSFGIRKIEVDAQRGFRLNGQQMKLKGGCIHHDNGPLGAAAIDRAEERKVELLKANGFNAIRTSHNPPSPAFLAACDRLGMLVIVEAFDQWNEAKIGNEQDYHRFFKDWHERDIASMVRAGRNHPSVIMWSIGNEIPEQFRAEATAKSLREAVLQHDPTRPVTAAICSDWGNVMKNWDKLSDPAFPNLDVAGYNYLPDKYESDHARHPERVIYGSESYPKDFFDYWTLVEKHPYVIGDFVWTAIDYFGEAGIGHSVLSNQKDSFFMNWPWFNAWCGDLDVCGFKKPQSLYRDVVWRRSLIEMAVHSPVAPGLTEKVSGWGWPDESQSWNWPGQQGKPMQVSVYSRCEKVRLELNGRVIAEKPVSDATKLTAKFDVPYSPGELRALGINKGKVVANTSIRTSGAPKKIKLTADRAKIRADRNDLSYITVEVVDANGRRVPDAEIPLRFSVSGAGELAAQASGSPDKPESFKAPRRTTFQGRCLAILRPTEGAGGITLRAEADGLEAGSVTVTTTPGR